MSFKVEAPKSPCPGGPDCTYCPHLPLVSAPLYQDRMLDVTYSVKLETVC